MSYIEISYRPIERWPSKLTEDRQFSRFDTAWNKTLTQLKSELWYLDAENVFFQIALEPHEFRNDGHPRATAKPRHPGVILTFDSKYGPQQYPCDTFTDFKDNVRAITLSLESLRRVDRYGVTKRGEQYTGWKALGAGIEMGAASAMTVEDAAQFIGHGNKGPWRDLIANRDLMENCYKQRAKELHPDVGGSTMDFQKLQESKRILDEVAS